MAHNPNARNCQLGGLTLDPEAFTRRADYVLTDDGLVREGAEYRPSPVPDWTTGGQSHGRKGRNRKGQTTQVIHRQGVARISAGNLTFDSAQVADPLNLAAALTALADRMADGYRPTGRELQLLADRYYDIDEMVGTDLASHSAADPAAVDAWHACGIAGGALGVADKFESVWSDSYIRTHERAVFDWDTASRRRYAPRVTVTELADPVPNARKAQKLRDRGQRYGIRLVPRDSEVTCGHTRSDDHHHSAACLPHPVVKMVGYERGEMVRMLIALPAPIDAGHMAIGSLVIPRGRKARRKKGTHKARTARQQAKMRALPTLPTGEHLTAQVAALKPRSKAVYVVGGTKVTVSRDEQGRYAYPLPGGKRGRARVAGTAARQLAVWHA